ncbi:unnamed protein product [Rotaria sp. Silwood1]|nr:unnamed protein product [Rotaria sp. Silwood1]CAF4919887.1 unnamed protein product [Rotaria sp. Silwood1]CAF4975992.1 unnamed protein product [Rotaria sp. Silwood1]
MSLTLRHLNADTSWLILFENFKILLDPWLFGSQSEFCRYFSTQEHAVRPSIQNINRDLGMQIDAIIISHEFTDHCHEKTLRSLSATIPVFATTNASNLIRQWNYFQHVYEIPSVQDVLVHRGATGGIGTVHHLLRAKVRLHWKCRRKTEKNVNYDLISQN